MLAKRTEGKVNSAGGQIESIAVPLEYGLYRLATSEKRIVCRLGRQLDAIPADLLDSIGVNAGSQRLRQQLRTQTDAQVGQPGLHRPADPADLRSKDGVAVHLVNIHGTTQYHQTRHPGQVDILGHGCEHFEVLPSQANLLEAGFQRSERLVGNMLEDENGRHGTYLSRGCCLPQNRATGRGTLACARSKRRLWIVGGAGTGRRGGFFLDDSMLYTLGTDCATEDTEVTGEFLFSNMAR